MKEPRHDDERLAALLEGRLEGPERDELLAYLAATEDEDVHVFAKTAAVLREMEEEDESARVHQAGEQVELPPPVRGAVPPSAKSGYRRWKALRAIVPTVLVGLVVLATFTRGRAGELENPMQVATRLEQAQRGLPDGWVADGRPWDQRGGERSDSTVRAAARAGVLLVDVEVAIRAGDAESISLLADQIQLETNAPQAPDNPLVQLRDGAGKPADELRRLLEQATEDLEGRLNRDYLRLGAWTEGALLAAVQNDVEFFRAERTRSTLARAEGFTRGDEAAQVALEKVRARISAGAAPTDLSGDLRQLMLAITS